MKSAIENRRVVLNVEGLEERSVPAGNVTADWAGVIYLTGDNASNEIQILVEDSSFGNSATCRITGLNGTTINGQDVVEFSGSQLFMDMGQGDDYVGIDLALSHPADLHIETGQGNDIVDLRITGSVMHGVWVIDTGNGDDHVAISGCGYDTSIDLLGIYTGNGDDLVSIDGAFYIEGNLSIDLGNGDDVLIGGDEGRMVSSNYPFISAGNGWDTVFAPDYFTSLFYPWNPPDNFEEVIP